MTENERKRIQMSKAAEKKRKDSSSVIGHRKKEKYDWFDYERNE